MQIRKIPLLSLLKSMGRKLPRVITTGSPKKLFLKYFVSYIIILSIPISISFIYFHGAMYAIGRMSQKQNIDMLKQSSAIFDERMDEVKRKRQKRRRIAKG